MRRLALARTPRHSAVGCHYHRPTQRGDAIACWALSLTGLGTAQTLCERLAANPWPAPEGISFRECRLFAPVRICAQAGQNKGQDIQAHPCPLPCAFERFSSALAQNFHSCRAHVIIGAAGIAVRALAPLLRHKSEDPPVLVLDAAGSFVVSLLSGHWGGGNALARHLAGLIGGQAVITTASDAADHFVPALDCLAREAGLHILDWEELPLLSSSLLEGRSVPLHDPLNCLPQANPPHFRRVSAEDSPDRPLASIHWRKIQPAPGLVRLVPKCLHLGIGFRLNVAAAAIEAAVLSLLEDQGLEAAALASIATVQEKVADPALVEVSQRLGLPILAYSAEQLAATPVPNPSRAAGAHFGQQPFSVCEAAALLAAQAQGKSILLTPKTIFESRITVAIALGKTSGQEEES